MENERIELTGKQRAALRSMANTIDPCVYIGKEGVTPALVKAAWDALEAHELVKCVVQKSAPLSARETCDELCEKTHAQPVQCIGYRFSIYRPSRKPKIEI